MGIIEIKNLLEEYGNTNLKKILKMEYLKIGAYLCPKCNGSGYGSEKELDITYCDLCDGAGYFEKQEHHICDNCIFKESVVFYNTSNFNDNKNINRRYCIADKYCPTYIDNKILAKCEYYTASNIDELRNRAREELGL